MIGRGGSRWDRGGKEKEGGGKGRGGLRGGRDKKLVLQLQGYVYRFRYANIWLRGLL